MSSAWHVAGNQRDVIPVRVRHCYADRAPYKGPLIAPGNAISYRHLNSCRRSLPIVSPTHQTHPVCLLAEENSDKINNAGGSCRSSALNFTAARRFAADWAKGHRQHQPPEHFAAETDRKSTRWHLVSEHAPEYFLQQLIFTGYRTLHFHEQQCCPADCDRSKKDTPSQLTTSSNVAGPTDYGTPDGLRA